MDAPGCPIMRSRRRIGVMMGFFKVFWVVVKNFVLWGVSYLNFFKKNPHEAKDFAPKQ
jgi:hypothetical protein